MDHLDEDIAPAKSPLKFAAISFAASKTRQRIAAEDKVALLVRGGFASSDEAMEHIKLLPRDLDTYVCELYKWILLGNITDDMDCNAHLNDMVSAVKKRNALEKTRFEERKKHAMEHSIDDVPEELDPLKNVVPGEQTPKDASAERDLKRLKVIKEEEGNGSSSSMTLSHKDTITVPDQHFVVVSCVAPDPEFQELTTPEGVVGIKIRGVFESKAAAEAHIKEVLSGLDDQHDMFIADMYRFLVFPCDDDAVETVYREEYLQGMFSDYEKTQQAAQTFMKTADMNGLERTVHPTELKAIESTN